MLNNQIVEESEYSKKLKHPRWQKKRLEILDRDKFTCQQSVAQRRSALRFA
jgi:hypothetical protein